MSLRNNNLRILILHRNGDPENAIVDNNRLYTNITNYFNSQNTIVHDVNIKLPNELKKLSYHLIVLCPTFLWIRNNRNKYENILSKYDFIKDNTALKVAFPQDDYDCSYFLDKWMTKWNINIIFTVLYNFRNHFYKHFIYNNKGLILSAYTTYISNDLINKWKSTRPFNKRDIDISYRTHDRGKYYCSIRNNKFELANIFNNHLSKNRKYKLDISNRTSDTITGIGWYDFLENSKFCLAALSGSSVIDQKGHIKFLINEQIKRKPDISFKEIKNLYLRNNDHYNFTAISPRNIEAILANTVQIASVGTYSGILEPEIHYIPLQDDFSNLDEILLKICDLDYIDMIKSNAKEAILSYESLRSESFTNKIEYYLLIHINNNNINLKSNTLEINTIDSYKQNLINNKHNYYSSLKDQ